MSAYREEWYRSGACRDDAWQRHPVVASQEYARRRFLAQLSADGPVIVVDGQVVELVPTLMTVWADGKGTIDDIEALVARLLAAAREVAE